MHHAGSQPLRARRRWEKESADAQPSRPSRFPPSLAAQLDLAPNPSTAVPWQSTIPQRRGLRPPSPRYPPAQPRRSSKWRSPDTAAHPVSRKLKPHLPYDEEPAPPLESHPDAAMSFDSPRETDRAPSAVFLPLKPTPPPHPGPTRAGHRPPQETRCTGSRPRSRDSESAPTPPPAPPLSEPQNSAAVERESDRSTWSARRSESIHAQWRCHESRPAR